MNKEAHEFRDLCVEWRDLCDKELRNLTDKHETEEIRALAWLLAELESAINVLSAVSHDANLVARETNLRRFYVNRRIEALLSERA